jgi:hypothetical protein
VPREALHHIRDTTFAEDASHGCPFPQKIVAIDILADPARLRRLDLAVLDD